MRAAHFDLVRGDDGWFARFIASNNKQVWRTSEVYARREGAKRAITVMRLADGETPMREVDERSKP